MRFPHLLLLVLLGLSACGHAHAGVTEPAVGGAIERIQQFLYGRQDPAAGGWEQQYANSPVHAGGETALVTLSLLYSGQTPQDPRIGKAIELLESIEMKGTYAVGLRAHVWAAISDDFRPHLMRDARWLLRAQHEGLFDYGPRRSATDRFDHSVTQFGVLGLWESGKRGGPSSEGLWNDVERHFLKAQLDNGAWAYQMRQSPKATMTAAGLNMLLLAQQRLHRHRHRPAPPLAAAIEKGIEWLDWYTNSRLNDASGGNRMYYQVSLERVALASGMKFLGGKDWFEAGAGEILKLEAGRGSLEGNVVDSAFALIFLARGRVPVWINKLRVADHPWNGRPNDIYFLTRYLSDAREHELNWQVVDIESDPFQWMNAPVAYLSCNKAVELSESAVANLRTYLDLGGLLLANPESGSTTFRHSIVRLGRALYPDHTFRPLEPAHPLFSLVREVAAPARAPARVGGENGRSSAVVALSNGVRELIVLPGADWGMRFQSGAAPQQPDPHRFAANLYAMVTDRGRLTSRLANPVEPIGDRAPAGRIAVVRATYRGTWNPEPRAWEPFRRWLFNRTGLELDLQEKPLDQIADAEAPFVHLAGVDSILLTEAQELAIHQYIDGGGTILAETVGGLGSFATELERHLRRGFGGPSNPLAADHPIICGEGVTSGFDVRRAVYRRYTVQHQGGQHHPRFTVVTTGQRPAILISQEDLSLAALGLRHWGINGYDVDSGRKLLANMLLWSRMDRSQESEVRGQESEATGQ